MVYVGTIGLRGVIGGGMLYTASVGMRSHLTIIAILSRLFSRRGINSLKYWNIISV